MPLIELEGVGKAFTAERGSRRILGHGGIADWVRRKRTHTFDALNNISFTIDRGEAVGIIGANGSGKSTLLKILAGVTTPTRGRVVVNGKVASLLELGAGFHPLLTGRENVYLNARILGMTPADVDRVFDRIVEFSGIEEFIDHPVETYSSGMFVRLGFAVAVHTNPDIFLVDEVLSVGDEDFQRRCRERIGQLREEGKTIVFVSHDLSIVNTLCERVILLTHGEMIVRDTAQATIDYYLRLVGRKQGIHTFAQGRVEAIESHGHVSIFYDRHEISAPAGFQVHLTSLGQVHSSTLADWEVVERGEAHCVARGRMPKLPVVQWWRLRIEENRLRWEISLEVERPVQIRVVETNLFLPLGYTRWYYGDGTGEFPPVPPGQTIFVTMAEPDTQIREAATLAQEDETLPTILVRMETDRENFRLQWVNTDYVLGCRALQAGGEIPLETAQFEPGTYSLISLELNLGVPRGEIAELAKQYQTARTISVGDATTQFDRGMLRLRWREEELTAAVHIYNSMLVNDLWGDSQNLHWGKVIRRERGITVSGRSRRFLFTQVWEIEPTENGLNLAIWLEAGEPLEVQEYHVSVGLKMAYNQWETPHERGEFTPILETDDDWHHLNRNYSAGTWARALSNSLPSVILEVTAGETPFRMTVINTGHSQSARVLQALRTPQAGRIHFELGRHLLFSGRVAIENA